jgi:hypothetical protein
MENSQNTKPTIYELLAKIQKKAKVEKKNKNAFGKYNYRNLEDILNIVKPLCCDAGLVLTITDELQEVAGRLFVKATATVTHTDNSSISASAYAQHASNKKGCDEAQLTGLTSSYARKYACQGLFAIDDGCQGLFAIDDGIDNDAVNDVPQNNQKKVVAIFNKSNAIKAFAKLDTQEEVQASLVAGISKYPNKTKDLQEIADLRLHDIEHALDLVACASDLQDTGDK